MTVWTRTRTARKPPITSPTTGTRWESFESWFGTKGVEPRKFYRDTNEGSYHCINDYKYDRAAGKIHANLQYGEEQITMDNPIGD